MAADTLCYCLKEPQDIDEAESLLKRARELDDTDPDSRAAYAMFLLRFRRLPAAAAALAKAGIATHEWHTGLVGAYAEAARSDESRISQDELEAVLNAAIKGARSPEDTVFGMLLSARLLPMRDAAREDIHRRAILLLPNHVDALKGYGQLLVRRGSMYEAITILKQAYALEPTDIHAASCLATAYVRSGKELSTGMQLLSIVLAAGFHTADALSAFAYCLQVGYGRVNNESVGEENDEDNDGAGKGGGGGGGSNGEVGREKLLRSGDLIAGAGANSDLKRDLIGGAGGNSDLKANAREVKHAADLYSKVLELVPDDAFSRQQYAVCLWRELGRPEEALEVLRVGLKLQPNCAYTRTLLATMLHREVGDDEAAEAEYFAALESSKHEYAVVPPYVFQRYCLFLLNRTSSSKACSIADAHEMYASAVAQHPAHASSKASSETSGNATSTTSTTNSTASSAASSTASSIAYAHELYASAVTLHPAHASSKASSKTSSSIAYAHELYASAVTLHPAHVGLLVDAARCYYLVKSDGEDESSRLEKREEARELLLRAYTLYPNQAVVVLAYAQFVDSVDGASCASALLYQRAYTLNPLDANAAAGLALHLHHFSTETERTEQTYQAALMLAPHDADLITNFALFKEEGLRDIRGAKRLLERALVLDPMDMECRIYYATLLADRFQETQEAHRQFQLAAELDPLNVKLLCKYGAFLEELPDTDAQNLAEVLYQQALAIEPTSPTALCSLGSLRYVVTHDLMGTVELYERALVNDPQHMLTLCNYAMLFHELLRTERRNKMMEFAHKIGAADADTREGLLKDMGVDALMSRVMITASQQPLYQKDIGGNALMSRVSESIAARYGQQVDFSESLCLSSSKKAVATVDMLQPLLDDLLADVHVPGGADGSSKLGSESESAIARASEGAHPSMSSRAMLTRATELYERALASQPKHVPAICNYAALMCQVASDHAKAQALYLRAAELEPTDATVLCNLGNLKREHNDDINGAETLYKKALASEPSHIQTLVSYGHQIALHSEDYDKAEDLLQTALSLQPSSTEALQGLEWIRNMRETFGRPAISYDSSISSAAPAVSRARLEWERRKSLKAASSSSGRVDPKAEAEAENMAKLLLEEEEQEVKQGLKGNKKPAVKKKKK